MTTPSQSSVTPETLQGVAALLPLPGCQCDHHYSQGEERSCREARMRDHAHQVRSLVEPWQQLTDERDQAIRERDEARAAVARVKALAAADLEPDPDMTARDAVEALRATLRAALSGGAGEQDKAEEGERG